MENVWTSSGVVRGERVGSVAAFSGIPFAAPPIGAFRWLRPQAVIPWGGILDCTSKRPKAERRAWPVQATNNISEDCLHLNIWTPHTFFDHDEQTQLAPAALVPVLVWIYGGSFTFGCKDEFYISGQPYAERGIVFVAANYRVGALGFLCPEGGDANCGFWDQVAVLAWVQANIEYFGGDPKQVTIMGESAGGDSCYYLCCSPAAKGLFQRAIIQSCSQFAITSEQGAELMAEFANVAGARSPQLEDMQALTPEQILRAQGSKSFRLVHTAGPGWRFCVDRLPQGFPPLDMSASGLLQMPEPVSWPIPTAIIDGEFLLEQPLLALAKGAAGDLDILIGCNRDENAFVKLSSWFPRVAHPLSFGVRLSGAGREEVLRRLVWEVAGMPQTLQEDSERLSSRCRSLLKCYEEEVSSDPCGYLKGSAGRSVDQFLMDTILSDCSFIAATTIICGILCRPGNSRQVYRYMFNGFGNFSGRCNQPSAAHATELLLCLGVARPCGMRIFRYGSMDVRRQWLDSWAEFVKTGSPCTVSMNGAWCPFDGHESTLFTWDGYDGWQSGVQGFDRRVGLQAMCKLWLELWHLDQPCPIVAGHG